MRRVRCTLVAMLGAMLLLGSGQSAHAASVDLTCPIAGTIKFNPGLTLLSRTVEVDGNVLIGSAVSALTPCSTVLTGVNYTGASGPLTGTATLACGGVGLNSLRPGSGSGTIDLKFDNGDRTTLDWNLIFDFMVPIVGVKASDGVLKGSSITVVPAPTGLSGNCLTPLRSIGFGGVMEVLRPAIGQRAAGKRAAKSRARGKATKSRARAKAKRRAKA